MTIIISTLNSIISSNFENLFCIFCVIVAILAVLCGGVALALYSLQRKATGDVFASIAGLLFLVSATAPWAYLVGASYLALWSKMGVLGVVWYSEFFILSYGAIDAVRTKLWTEKAV